MLHDRDRDQLRYQDQEVAEPIARCDKRRNRRGCQACRSGMLVLYCCEDNVTAVVIPSELRKGTPPPTCLQFVAAMTSFIEISVERNKPFAR